MEYTVHGILQAGVGSHSFLQGNLPNPGIKPQSPTLQVDSLPVEPPEKLKSRSVISDSLQPQGLYSPKNSPGQNTGVDNLSLLQGIFPTQGLNPGLPHCRQILYQLSHKGSPRILEWVAYPFSSRSSWPRNRTRVSCIAGRFFTNWAKPWSVKYFHVPICPLYLIFREAEIFFKMWPSTLHNSHWLYLIKI